MQHHPIAECPKCGSRDLSRGIQLNQGNMFPEKDILLFKFGSEIRHLFCTDCGFVIESYVQKPEKFKSKK